MRDLHRTAAQTCKRAAPGGVPAACRHPTGYACGGGPRSCLLSGLYTEAKVTHARLFDDDPDPGLTTLRGSIHEISAIVDRAAPVHLHSGYLEIASDAISTDVPVELLPALVDLSRAARTREIPSLPIASDAARPIQASTPSAITWRIP